MHMGNNESPAERLRRIKTGVLTLDNARQVLRADGVWTWSDDESCLESSRNLGQALLQVAGCAAGKIAQEYVDVLLALYHAHEELARRVENALVAVDEHAGTSDRLDRLEQAVLARFDTIAVHEPSAPAPPVDLQPVLDILAKQSRQLDALPVKIGDTLSGPTTSSSVGAARFAGRDHGQQDAIARIDLLERQALVNASSSKNAAWTLLAPKDLVKKANTAIKAVRSAHPLPEDSPLLADKALIVVAVQRIAHGGVVLNLPSAEAVAWLFSHATAFTRAFAPGSLLKPRDFPIVARRIPVGTEITDPTFLRKLEADNKLPAHTITHSRWVKSEQRRNRKQRVAHAVLCVSSAEAANRILDSHMQLDGELVKVERLIPEPKRCAKCQDYGHFAKECTTKTAVCGSCSKPGHQSDKCTANPDAHRCASCTKRGYEGPNHAAWSRECPVRLRLREKMFERRPENFAHRFLTPTNADLVFPRISPVSRLAHAPARPSSTP